MCRALGTQELGGDQEEYCEEECIFGDVRNKSARISNEEVCLIVKAAYYMIHSVRAELKNTLCGAPELRVRGDHAKSNTD